MAANYDLDQLEALGKAKYGEDWTLVSAVVAHVGEDRNIAAVTEVGKTPKTVEEAKHNITGWMDRETRVTNQINFLLDGKKNKLDDPQFMQQVLGMLTLEDGSPLPPGTMPREAFEKHVTWMINNRIADLKTTRLQVKLNKQKLRLLEEERLEKIRRHDRSDRNGGGGAAGMVL